MSGETCGEPIGRTGRCDMPKGHAPISEVMGWLHSETLHPASSAARDGDGDPTEPRPVADQLRDLIRANQQLTAERDEARAAVERVRAIVAKAEQDAERSPARMFDGSPFPPSVWHADLRRALDGTDA